MSIPNWENSEGRIAGCLPRASRPGEFCSFFPKGWVIPKSDWADILAQPHHMQLRPSVPVILDQDGVGSCLPAGTCVRMGDGSEKPIEDVQVLDEVLTAEGNVKTVTQTMVRKHCESICQLLINGSHHVQLTPNHPVLTENGYVAAGNLKKGDFVAFPRYIPQSSKIIQTLDYVWERHFSGSHRRIKSKANSVCHREVVGRTAQPMYKHQLPDIIHLTKGFGRIIGLFLAEGCTSYSKLDFTFANHEETTLAQEVVDLLQSELDIVASLRVRGNGVIKVTVYGVAWSRLFEALCSKLSSGKKLHLDLAAGPKDFLEGVLSGWTDGDGIAPGRFGGTSVSHALALGMFDIANALGHKPTIRVKRNPKLSHGVKSRQDVWTVEWGQSVLKTDYRKHQTDTHVWRHVEGIAHEPFNDYVFNLEVEDDHSYVAEGIGVHNCATEATTQTVMTLRSFNGQKFELLNPWFVYYTTSGGRDGGSNIDTNLKFVRENGIAPESVWPRSKGWRAKPSDEAYEKAKDFKILEFFDIRNTEELGSALLLGFPVAYGRSGHAITAVDLVTTTTMRYANSWGNWGDEGFAVESINRVNFGYGAWAVRVVSDMDNLPSRFSTSEILLEPYPIISS